LIFHQKRLFAAVIRALHCVTEAATRAKCQIFEANPSKPAYPFAVGRLMQIEVQFGITGGSSGGAGRWTSRATSEV
jgi:hypothetical protein